MKITRFKLILLFVFLCSILFVNAQKYSTDSLKQLLRSAKEDSVRIDLLEKLSGQYIWSYPDSGTMYAMDGFRLSKKLDDRTREGLFLFYLCVSHSYTGDFASSLDYGFKALTLFQDLRDTSNIINSRIALAISYRDQGDYNQALIQGFKAKEMQELLPFDSAITNLILGNISSIYEKKNLLDSAIIYGLKALELGNQWQAGYITLGNVYSKMGNQPKALEYYKKGIIINTPDGFSRALSELYNGASQVFESIGQKDSSIYFAQKAYLNAEKIDYLPGVLEASKQLAHLYEKKGMQDSTIKYLKLSADLNESIFSRQKTREATSFAANNQLHQQELNAQHLLDRNKMRIFALLSILGIILLWVFFLFRNIRHKKKSNLLLHEKNTQIQSTLADLKSTQAQLIQSEKMASLGELTAGIAHEIQNPLNFVNNFSEVNEELINEAELAIDTGSINEAKELLTTLRNNQSKINQHGKRADAIVKGMLQHSRESKGQKEPADINALAGEYLRLSYQGLRAKDEAFKATLQTNFDPTIGAINIIPQDIGRVLLNLYNNAFYAVSEKKKHQPHGYEPTVSVSTTRVDGKVEIRVKDNGTGIPQKVKDKIFHPFFTTKPTGQGTGLGLSLSYDIVKAHGGEIEVETKEWEFTEFVIQLPVSV